MTRLTLRDADRAFWRRSLSAGLALFAGLIWMATARAAQAPQAPADDAPARMSGIWKLNKDLEKPGDPATEPPATGGGQTSGGHGGSRRGGGGRGGGFGGGGRTFGGGGSGNQAEMLQRRELMRETTEAPTQLVIVATAASVTLTDEEGHVRKFAANDKKQKLDIGTEVDAKAKWDDGTFRTELSAGSLKVTTAYQVTVQGHELVVTSQLQGGGRGGSSAAVPVRHTYDKAE